MAHVSRLISLSPSTSIATPSPTFRLIYCCCIGATFTGTMSHQTRSLWSQPTTRAISIDGWIRARTEAWSTSSSMARGCRQKKREEPNAEYIHLLTVVDVARRIDQHEHVLCLAQNRHLLEMNHRQITIDWTWRIWTHVHRLPKCRPLTQSLDNVTFVGGRMDWNFNNADTEY